MSAESKAHEGGRDEAWLAMAHRIAWRYKKSSDPAHSDTYTFNRDTLLQFARGVVATLAKFDSSSPADAPSIQELQVPAWSAAPTGDVWLKHDDDLRFVARVLSGGLQAPKADIKAAREIVHGLRTTARSHVQPKGAPTLPEPHFVDQATGESAYSADQMRAAFAAQSTAPNLACPSVQARLAAQWGYVPAREGGA